MMPQADGTEYNVAVSTSTTLSLLTEFAELDLIPPRPGYVVVRGQPISSESCTSLVSVKFMCYLFCSTLVYMFLSVTLKIISPCFKHCNDFSQFLIHVYFVLYMALCHCI